MEHNKNKKNSIEKNKKELNNSKIRAEIKPYKNVYNIYSYLIIYIYKTVSILLLFTYRYLNIKISKPKKTFLFINLIIFFTFINFSKEDNILQLNYFYEIKITVKGIGNQMILSNQSSEYNGRILKFSYMPNEILINNEPQNYTGNYAFGLISQVNNITMRWNEPFIDTNCMFYKMNNIISFDFSNFDTKGVTEMINMFKENSIQNLDLSTFNTSSVINMAGMFDFCWNLISLDISNFDTSLVVDFSQTFRSLLSLTSLNIDNLNTKSSTSMTGMFEINQSLTSLNLRNFITSKVYSMWCMFCDCNLLKFLDLSSFNNIFSY